MENYETIFSNKGDFHNKIILIENDEFISDNKEVAQKLNNFFEPAVKSLGIIENQSLLSTSNRIDDPILQNYKNI